MRGATLGVQSVHTHSRHTVGASWVLRKLSPESFIIPSESTMSFLHNTAPYSTTPPYVYSLLHLHASTPTPKRSMSSLLQLLLYSICICC